jgi:bla regulator protein blaR1
MKARIAVVATLLAVSACAERLTGPDAQQAARDYQSKTIAADKTPILFLDGTEVTADVVRTFPADSIASVEVIKGGKALEKYGSRAQNGVILIVSKRAAKI